MTRKNRRSETAEATSPGAEEDNILRESPEPMTTLKEDGPQQPHKYSHPVHHQQQIKSHSTPATVKNSSNPIHHHIAPAFVAPFMKADGLVNRGPPLNLSLWGWY